MEFLRDRWSSSTLVEQSLHAESHSDISELAHTSPNRKNVINTAATSGTKSRLDFTHTLEIHVGDEGCFLVPQNRIMQRSEFFRDYCSQRDTDGEEILVVDLPNQDRFVFDIYLQVVYQDEVILPLHVEEADDPHWSVTAMIRTYRLTDKLQDMRSCNIIIDSLIDFCSSHGLVLVSDDWKLIFRDFGKESVLRTLAVDFCVIATQPDFLKTQLRSMPMEMALDCVARFADLRREMLMDLTRGGASDTPTSLADLDRCKNYHQHGENCLPCPGRSHAEPDAETPSCSRDSPASSGRSSTLGSFHSAQQYR
jgi:hypothetical protein